MKSLYWRIWLTVVAVLAAFALISGWLWQRHVEQERTRQEQVAGERLAAWGELLQRSLPGPDAPASDQASALNDWSTRLRVPLALDDANGKRIGASEIYLRRVQEMPDRRGAAIPLDDGRTLWLIRPGPQRLANRGFAGGDAQSLGRPPPGAAAAMQLGLPPGVGLLLLLAVLFAAVALGAFPVVRRLTRRLETLKSGVETFGAGSLNHRVPEEGRDEVAAVAASFNRAAARIEALVRSHQSLLANASHELRSPLARLKMAVAMLDTAQPAQRERLRLEIHTNIAELDALVEEVLLASRLDTPVGAAASERVDVLALTAEEAARVGAVAEGEALSVPGDERLIRRAVRNLLENARRYGQVEVQARVTRAADGQVEVQVSDRGPGVPPEYRERIFEPFFRLPGHAEREGGVGLGLSLVKQIAQRHGGSVRCDQREGGGSRFVLSLRAP